VNETNSTLPTGATDSSLDPREALRELSLGLLDQNSLGSFLERVASVAVRSVPGADQVSITLMENDGSRPRSVAFTGDLAVALDERQYEAGYGPCLNAAETGMTVPIPDTGTTQVYPDFGAQCQQRGVHSTLSVGLPIAGRSIGAMNIYDLTGGVTEPEAVKTAEAFAGYASIVLANAAVLADSKEFADQMQAAMQHRSVIEQAKGMIMLQNGCSEHEAFAELATRSQRDNVKLREVAEHLVEQTKQRQVPDDS
jgi:GAF domain-containing protein